MPYYTDDQLAHAKYYYVGPPPVGTKLDDLDNKVLEIVREVGVLEKATDIVRRLYPEINIDADLKTLSFVQRAKFAFKLARKVTEIGLSLKTLAKYDCIRIVISES